MAESKDGSDERSGPHSKQEDRTHPWQAERFGKQEKVTFSKGPGFDWIIEYRFDGEEAEEMSVFGTLTIDKAIEEARYSLNGLDNMNVGSYEILSVTRADWS